MGWLLMALRKAVASARDEDDVACNEQKGSAEESPTPTNSPELPGDGGLSAGVARIRATSRWIIVSFGGIAAILIGTAPLDKIGAVGLWSPQFWVALFAIAVTIAAVTLAICSAAAVDQPVGISVAELVAAEGGGVYPSTYRDKDKKPLVKAATWIKEADLTDIKTPCEPNGCANPATHPIAFLSEQRDIARDNLQETQCRIECGPEAKEGKELTKQLDGRRARFTRLDTELGKAVDLAAYHRIRGRFDRKKRYIVTCAVFAALGIVTFKYTISIEERPRNLAGITLTDATDADLHGANLAGARLEGADLIRADLSGADLTGARLARANLEGTKLGGADLTAVDLTGAANLTPEQVSEVKSWIGATCPDGKLLQKVKARCATEAQLKPPDRAGA